MVDYSGLIAHLEELHERYPRVWDLRLIKRPSRMLLEMVGQGMRVLDIGAADRRMERRIREKYPDVVYKSMDIDRGFHHDFYSLDDIHETFDLIVLFEVIEHLELADGARLLSRLRELMAEDGRIIISTPNIYHPHRYWHNADHKTAYSYSELAGAMMSRGYEIVDIYRTYNAPFLEYLFRMTLAYPLHRTLDIDFAHSVVVVARKGKGKPASPSR